MPCDSIRLNQVDVGKMDRDTLLKALAAKEWQVWVNQPNGRLVFDMEGERVTLNDGRLTVRQGMEHLADRLKVAYSQQVVKAALGRFNWQYKATNKEQTAFVATRRF